MHDTTIAYNDIERALEIARTSCESVLILLTSKFYLILNPEMWSWLLQLPLIYNYALIVYE